MSIAISHPVVGRRIESVAGPASVAPTSAAPATRLRMTARGRRVLVALIAVPLAGVIAWGAISGGSALATHESGAPAGSFRVETAYAGDTLWSIAERVAPNADPRDVVAEIKRLNALSSSQLTPGQELAIPAQYGG